MKKKMDRSFLGDCLPILSDIVTGLSKHFADDCEFVLHDYSQPFDSTIVAIGNGHVTGRGIGDSGTGIGLKVMQGIEEESGKYGYITQTKDGRLLRSSTIFLRDSEKRVVGSLCINYDITHIHQAINQLNRLVSSSESEESGPEPVNFGNVGEILVQLIKDSIAKVGTPVALMTRAQKIEGIRYLNKCGAFRIKNAGNIVAEYYDISKFTIYNYLGGEETADSTTDSGDQE